jgi:ribosomal protein L37E
VNRESYSTDGPECPACGFTFTPDEPHYYSDTYTEDECPDCGVKFKIEVYSWTSWSCEEIDAQE